MSESIELILEQLDELEEQERHIKEADFEIERLKEENKKYNKWIESLNKDNHRLNNIIKEVREKIKNHLYAKTILNNIYSDNEIFEFILEKTGDIDEQR